MLDNLSSGYVVVNDDRVEDDPRKSYAGDVWRIINATSEGECEKYYFMGKISTLAPTTLPVRPVKWRCKDDDGILYYEGTASNEDVVVVMHDHFRADSGTVLTELKDDLGRWVAFVG